jgi:hypothetical protein
MNIIGIPVTQDTVRPEFLQILDMRRVLLIVPFNSFTDTSSITYANCSAGVQLLCEQGFVFTQDRSQLDQHDRCVFEFTSLHDRNLCAMHDAVAERVSVIQRLHAELAGRFDYIAYASPGSPLCYDVTTKVLSDMYGPDCHILDTRSAIGVILDCLTQTYPNYIPNDLNTSNIMVGRLNYMVVCFSGIRKRPVVLQSSDIVYLCTVNSRGPDIKKISKDQCDAFLNHPDFFYVSRYSLVVIRPS